MPTMQPGIHTTQTYLSDLQERDIAREVFLEEAQIAPVMSVLQALPTYRPTSWKVEWAEDVMDPHVDAINKSAGYLNTDKTFIVDNPGYFNVDDYIKVPRTSEIMGPIVDVSGTDITVGKRGAGETAGQALVDNDILVIIRGNIRETGDAAEAIATIPVMQYNYLQRFSHSVKVSEDLENINLYPGSERERQRQKKFMSHREDIELALLFGERGQDNSASNGPRLLMRGLLKWITTNVKTVINNPRVFTENDWNDWLRMLFTLGGTEKNVFCSGEVLQQISEFGIASMMTRPGDKELGLDITSYISPFGRVNLIYHRFFTSTYNLAWKAMALDLDMIDYAPLTPSKMRPNIQPPQSHYIWDEFYTVCTMRFRIEKRHGLFEVKTS